eukprot:UN09801
MVMFKNSCILLNMWEHLHNTFSLCELSESSFAQWKQDHLMGVEIGTSEVCGITQCQAMTTYMDEFYSQFICRAPPFLLVQYSHCF